MRLIVCFVILLSLIGCLAERDKPIHEGKDKPTEIILTPIDLFKGDGAKFQNFLGTMSGAFKLRYEGNKPNANLDVDIWNNGKKVSSSGSIGDLFFSSVDRENHEVEVIISMDTESIEGQDNVHKIKVATINDSGSSLVTFTNPWDKKLTAWSLINNHEPRTFIAEKSVYVWGIQATSTNQIRTADLSLETLSRLEWAIIFTLRFED